MTCALPLSLKFHSTLSASIGFKRAARRAGIQIANSATSARSAGTAVKTIGSQARTPKRNPARKRARKAAAANPTTTPRPAVNMPFPTTRLRIRASVGPKRHAYADLMRALSDGISHYAVDPNRSERQRCHCEDTKQKHVKVLPCDRVGEDLIHGANPPRGQASARFSQLLRDVQSHLMWLKTCTDEPEDRAKL